MTTGDRWQTLWARLGANTPAAPVFRALIDAYSEAHRHYHTLAHLQDCLAQFDAACPLAVHPAEVEAALWFHDAIYHTRAADNEELSAQWAQRALRAAGVAADVTQRVADLVRVTRHDARPTGADACLLVDIDLSILGRAVAEFEAYERHIRAEYAWVPELHFRQGRARILEAFLARPSIYETAVFQAQYEAQARDNLARSLASLRASS
jgi:predicted metal-dependent HD superfamily phosphohydrolase